MRIAFPVFDNITALDAVGPYKLLRLLPAAEVVFVTAQPGPVRAPAGLTLPATHPTAT